MGWGQRNTFKACFKKGQAFLLLVDILKINIHDFNHLIFCDSDSFDPEFIDDKTRCQKGAGYNKGVLAQYGTDMIHAVINQIECRVTNTTYQKKRLK